MSDTDARNAAQGREAQKASPQEGGREGSDLLALYSRQILSHAASIPHTEPIAPPFARACVRSPLCGSTIDVSLRMKGEAISAFSQDVKACALGQAAAAILGAHVIGRTREDIVRVRDALHAMLKGGDETPPPPFEALELLRPARDYRNRHASIMLACEATLQAMDRFARGECVA